MSIDDDWYDWYMTDYLIYADADAAAEVSTNHRIINLILKHWWFWDKTELKAVVEKGERHQRRLNGPFNIPRTQISQTQTLQRRQPTTGQEIVSSLSTSINRHIAMQCIFQTFLQKGLFSTPALRGQKDEQKKKMLICEIVLPSRTKRPPSSRQPPRSKAISQLLRQLVEGRRIQDASQTSSSSASRSPSLSCKAFNQAPCYRFKHQMGVALVKKSVEIVKCSLTAAQLLASQGQTELESIIIFCRYLTLFHHHHPPNGGPPCIL